MATGVKPAFWGFHQLFRPESIFLAFRITCGACDDEEPRRIFRGVAQQRPSLVGGFLKLNPTLAPRT